MAVTATVIDARTRLYKAVDASSPLYGSAIGRLSMDRRSGVTEKHMEAAEKLERDYRRYYSMFGIPNPYARAQDVSRLGGESGPIDPDEARKASSKFMALEGVLGGADVSGRPVTTCVKRLILCDEDLPTREMIAWAVRGLDALVEYYK